jgi:hypothetical protein
MDLSHTESTVLYSNDEDGNSLKSLPELEREAILLAILYFIGSL